MRTKIKLSHPEVNGGESAFADIILEDGNLSMDLTLSAYGNHETVVKIPMHYHQMRELSFKLLKMADLAEEEAVSTRKH